LVGKVGDDKGGLGLKLFVDADFAGDRLDAKSNNGGFLKLEGNNTSFPLMWVAKKQTSVSRSTTEAEVISLAYSLFLEGLPALDLWQKIIGPSINLEVFEDNQATIKVVEKGYSPKLRHIQRTHKVNLGSIKEVFDGEGCEISYITTDKQAADIFTKALPPQKWGAALNMIGIFSEPLPKCVTAHEGGVK
jgi:hypothetical protein